MADLIESVVRTGVIVQGKEVLLVTEVPKTTQPAFQVHEEDIAKNSEFLRLEIEILERQEQQLTLGGDLPGANGKKMEADARRLELTKFQEIVAKMPPKKDEAVEKVADALSRAAVPK